MGKDISLAARYHFVYFPVVIVLIAVALGNQWQDSPAPKVFSTKHHLLYAQGKRVAVVLLLMGFLGSLTVVSDLGFQKSRHSDRLAAHIQATSTIPTLIAMTYDTHSQLRELIALALSFERLSSKSQSLIPKQKIPQFLLVRPTKEKDKDHSFSTLSKILKSQPKPLNLWGINLKVDKENLSKLNCTQDKKFRLSNTGYRNRFYYCR